MTPLTQRDRPALAVGITAFALALVPGIAAAAATGTRAPGDGLADGCVRGAWTGATTGRCANHSAVRASAAPASAARASLPGPIAQRTFNVDLSGVQSTAWTLHDPSRGACDPALTGSGSERVSFQSVKPERVVVRRYGTSYVILGDPYHVAANDLLTHAAVTRHGTVSSSSVSPACAESGGLGGPVSPPDCGTKRVAFDVQIGYVNQPRHGFTLTDGDLGTLGEPFKNCPWTGGVVTFPKLLDQDGPRPIVAAIPVADLFNRAYEQQIVLGHGRHTTDGAGVRTTTRINWSIRLTSVKR